MQDDVLYLFYETKNSVTMQGDIGVSRSTDKGVTWKQLGTALDENWHLSYPYVFNYNDQVTNCTTNFRDFKFSRSCMRPFQPIFNKH